MALGPIYGPIYPVSPAEASQEHSYNVGISRAVTQQT